MKCSICHYFDLSEYSCFNCKWANECINCCGCEDADFIGIAVDADTLCFECAKTSDSKTLLSTEGYPDGFTCAECGDSITITGEREDV